MRTDASELTKNEWENEIARHILSLYATSKAAEHIEEQEKSESLVRYVDSKRPDTASIVTLKNDVFMTTEDSNAEYLKEISSSGALRGGAVSRGGTRGLVAEEAFGFPLAASSRPGTTNLATSRPTSKAASSRAKSPFVVRRTPVYLSLREDDIEQMRSDPLPAIATDLNHRSSPVVVKAIPRCSPIWFISAGDVYVDWTVLPGGRKLQHKLNALYEAGRLKDYVSVIEMIISDLWSAHSTRIDILRKASKVKESYDNFLATSSMSVDSITKKNTMSNSLSATSTNNELSVEKIQFLWKQLITTTNALSIIAIERKSFVEAHDLLHMAEGWNERKDLISKEERVELKAHILSVFAYYFYKRQKLSSARTYTMRAMSIYERIGANESVAVCLLHTSVLQCLKGQFKDSHKSIYQFLAMLEDGSLSLETASPRQLCLVAIGYHNLAVVQLKLEVADLACKSSQNARKIARLCLPYSNRWIESLQRTHDIAVEDVKQQILEAAAVTQYGDDTSKSHESILIELADTLLK